MPSTDIWHSETIEQANSSPKTPEQPFIWLHGWGHTSSALSRLAGLFKKNGCHTLYDQPGFGKTPALHEGAGSQDYADALAKQLGTALKGSKGAILVGHSYGARVSVQMASRYPDLIKAIILISGAGLRRKRSVAHRVRAGALKLIGRLARLSDAIFGTRYRDAYVKRFGSRDYQNAGVLRGTLVSAVNEDLSALAQQIKCPTLLIYGGDDTETPPEFGHRYEGLIPIARCEILKGYGHNDILERGAYQCEALIRTFLKDLNGGRDG
ncbi:MAG: alpha/beta hydrolase [Kordiimonadaceae bacterium]|nr:alpha/beta hydrolase [Kordiimonadaceae bacterium]